MKKIICLLPVFLLFLACEKAEKAKEAATPPPTEELGFETFKQEEAESSSISVANVVLKPASGEPVILTVEIAQTPEERRQGLQGRENLAQDHGMWFVFEDDGQDPFWMRNTLISLDILFIDADDKIVDIVKDTVPNSEDLIVSRHPYRFALEVAAGVSDRHGLRVGDAVEFRLGPP